LGEYHGTKLAVTAVEVGALNKKDQKKMIGRPQARPNFYTEYENKYLNEFYCLQCRQEKHVDINSGNA
jgi:hypothetical protein